MSFIDTDTHSDLLTAARIAHARRDWHASYAGFTCAGEFAALSTDDLDALASAAWRLGRSKEAVRVAERVYAELSRSDPGAAATKAVELGLVWLTRGDLNIGQGWMSRARRLLDGTPEGPTHGYLAYLDAVVAILTGDSDVLPDRVKTLRALSLRIDTPALTSLGLVAEALAAILEARTADAFGMLDEAMLPVLADDVPLEWAGDIYCLVLHHCHRLADLPRMRAWTQSMARWCEDSGSPETYGGVCDVRRLQLLSAMDDYRILEGRLLTACTTLEFINPWAAGEGFHQLGEVRRLRGDDDGAFAAYAKARSLGIRPQPGEALLRCRRGERDRARNSLRNALAESDRLSSMRLLHAAVEVALARDCIEEADQHCRELEAGAAAFDTPGFRAWAAHSRGAILVRTAAHAQALEVLESALREYRTQQLRYETAQVYEWMSLAHRALGASELATADLATAESIYREIGAESGGICGAAPVRGGLTRREIDILTRVAGGCSNRQVAALTFISEKTVGRHLANIYAKLDVSSRTAAVAWAHANNVLRSAD